MAVLTVGALGGSLHGCRTGRERPIRPRRRTGDRPAQLENFKAAIKESVETSVRVEPGVLVLYAVAEKDDPTRFRVFEIYTDAEAYRTHLETPHFKKFRTTTENMVKSRKLFDAVPVAMSAKGR